MIFNAVGGCVNPYPVGAIYLSAAATSPASLFGGTWERLKDRFLLGAGDTYTVGDTGGESEHQLTVAEMPSHYHDDITINDKRLTVWGEYGSSGAFAMDSLYNSSVHNNNFFRTGNLGGDKPHNNMPPYLAVYMWKRVA